MESNSRFSQLLGTLGDRISDQAWVQQLKAKWEELDPQSRLYLRGAGITASILTLFLVILSSLWGVRSLKTELAEKEELLSLLQGSSDEIRRLRESGVGRAEVEGASGPWAPYLESQAQTAGIDRAALSISDEKPVTTGGTKSKGGSSDEGIKESLLDISFKKINIKQLIRFIHSLEQGGRPVKVRNLSIDTQPDLSGYMNATLAVSAFSTSPKSQ